MRLIATAEGILPAHQALADQANLERRGWLKRLGAALGLGMLAGPALAAPRGVQGTAGIDPFIGEIMMFAGNFEIRGWAFCNGQLLSIAQNTALFSILGTTYGGNGTTTFGLPNLQGRFPLHFSNSFLLGQTGGNASVTMLSTQMPAHTHSLNVSSAAATASSPAGQVLAMPNGITSGSEEAVSINAYGATPNGAAAASAIGLAGGNQPLSVQNPYLALNFLIATQGIFPSRN